PAPRRHRCARARAWRETVGVEPAGRRRSVRPATACRSACRYRSRRTVHYLGGKSAARAGTRRCFHLARRSKCRCARVAGPWEPLRTLLAGVARGRPGGGPFRSLPAVCWRSRSHQCIDGCRMMLARGLIIAVVVVTLDQLSKAAVLAFFAERIV